jgi:hypothetical protein
MLQWTFEQGGETIHAVVLRQTTKLRWNAFLWGAGLQFANSFARRENAEEWLQRLRHHYFPTVEISIPAFAGSTPPQSGELPQHYVRKTA